MSDPVPQPEASAPDMRARLARLATHGISAVLPPQYIAATMARIDPRTERSVAVKDGAVAVIPVRGVIVPREDRFSQFFGEVGSENVAERARVAAEDKRVKTIVFDVDSPGGAVSGCTEASNVIRSLRGKKPMVAHVDWTMCSAAYWLLCGVDDIVASPSALVGAVGVIEPFFDEQEMLKLMGIKATVFCEPADKGDGWGLWPNTDKFEPRKRAEIAEAYNQFVNDIAASRTIDRAAVKADWAGVYNAKRAQLLGMVDKVRSIQETFAAYTANVTGPQAARNKLALLKSKKGRL